MPEAFCSGLAVAASASPTETPPSRGDRSCPFKTEAGRTDASIELATVRHVRFAGARLPADQLLYERRNGRFVLQITGHPDFGVPFGQDRLVPIFLATLAVQQKSQTVRFRTAAEMLESFGMHTGGKEYRRLVAAFERVFGATTSSGTDTDTARSKVIQRSRFDFMSEAQIWYSRAAHHPVLSSEFENIVVLSEEFYKEVSSHPLPNDLEAVKVLAGSCGARPLHVADVQVLQGHRHRNHTGYLAISVSPGRLGPWNTPGRAASVACWSSGCRRLGDMAGMSCRIAPNGEQLIVGHAEAVRQVQQVAELS